MSYGLEMSHLPAHLIARSRPRKTYTKVDLNHPFSFGFFLCALKTLLVWGGNLFPNWMARCFLIWKRVLSMALTLRLKYTNYSLLKVLLLRLTKYLFLKDVLICLKDEKHFHNTSISLQLDKIFLVILQDVTFTCPILILL